ncbi:cellulase family glycosylhydrolase [Tautonia marina]|uniref:cellulase family glycosylhydrolase n=1 Tax=Tautonia marina TaxID=2653855 RepID=UPI00126047F7|nr:cellulase family glycosylhydrolase [Tautonia marina]
MACSGLRGRRGFGPLAAVMLGFVLGLGGLPPLALAAGGDPVRATPQFEILPGPAPLQVSGRSFVDPSGRVILLRGINLAGDSKVPPFAPRIGPADLDRVAELGFNVIRLLIVWEAYEPSPGVYDEAYLTSVMTVAAEAARRGLYTIVDFHQDGFSRHASYGTGDGFPRWAVSPRGRPSTPNNGPLSSDWPLMMALDPTTHLSFADFYADTHGVRSRYLIMISRVASAFATIPGVIGYDLINEPWGDERRELAPLYRDANAVIRSVHPSAILFLEGHVKTNTGIQTRLPRPEFGPVAYAPHYYNPSTIVLRHWHGLTATMDLAFHHMTSTAEAWNCPLFVGEFGMDARVTGSGAYVEEVYDRLDAAFASGAHWNLTPGWTDHLKDGWNGEDFSILDPSGRIRPNYRPRPYPRATAGVPTRFAFDRGSSRFSESTVGYDWIHDPERGLTEVFVPRSVFPPGFPVEVRAADPAAVVSVWYDASSQRLQIQTDRPTAVSLRASSR